MSELPVGTITFLFTDVEGSTKLWEQYPDAMRQALIRHDALIEACVAAHAGTVVRPRGEGDSRFAVFPRVTDAVAAACAIQRTLFSEPWPTETPLRVRLALHTGEADLREGDYYGTAVNRCARLRAIAHGGQTLLSLATAELVRDALPAGASLRDLGLHRLKDLQRPEQVFQLMSPDLPADFPPLKSLDTLPNNLPRQLTSFIGREREMAEVKQLLHTTSLLTLTGAGGCGKTRLALQVAADLLEEYPDGVWLVELATLADPTLVPQTVASALGVREEPGRPLFATLSDYLSPKHLLLVLDNCEHLVEACATLANSLLRGCPKLRILATGREALGIAGEVAWRVPSLSLPFLHPLPPIESLTQYEAVRLFIERATAALPAFTVTNPNAPAVAQICHRLDGIPLAIELAAARVKVLSVEQMLARLEDRFRLLTGGSRAALPRHQTLRAAVDWSYALLSEPERTLFNQLSVFAGGWTLEAAEAICAGEGIEEYEVLDLLSRLVDKSLVVAEEGADGEVRYRLLETLRQYGHERLLASGEASGTPQKHAAFCLALVEKADSELQGPQQASWLDRLSTEHDNLRAALRWSVESGEADAGLRLGGALWRFWEIRGYLSEGRQWLMELLALSGDAARTAARAKALHGAGVLAHDQGDYQKARVLYEESLAIRRTLMDKRGIAGLLNSLGILARGQGNYPQARTLYEESLSLFRELEDKRGIAQVLNNLGNVAHLQGDYALARALVSENLAIQRELGNKRRIAYSLNNLGEMAYHQGDHAGARALFEEGLALFRELGDKQNIATILNNLGGFQIDQGDYAAAHALYEESLAMRRELGDKQGIASSLYNLGTVSGYRSDSAAACALWQESLAIYRELGNQQGIAGCLKELAGVAGAQGLPERSARLFGAAEALRQAIGASLTPRERADYERNVAAVRATLSEDTFATLWAEERAMTLEQAIAYALEKTESGT